jgi:hypothetical protein
MKGGARGRKRPLATAKARKTGADQADTSKNLADERVL